MECPVLAQRIMLSPHATNGNRTAVLKYAPAMDGAVLSSGMALSEAGGSRTRCASAGQSAPPTAR
eukprot:1238021-Rhodomonas_salina.1